VGAYNAPQTLYRDIRATSKGKEGMGREGEMVGKERGKWREMGST